MSDTPSSLEFRPRATGSVMGFPAHEGRPGALGEVHARPHPLVAAPRVLIQLSFMTEGGSGVDLAVLTELSMRLGIAAQVRLIDDVQYWRRLSAFDFDMIQWTWPASASPGNEQIGRWGSANAERRGALNYAGVKSPAVDATLQALLRARRREEFVAAVRTLDRLLISGFYVVPLYYLPDTWLAHARDVVLSGRQPSYFLANETLARLSAPAAAN